MKRHHQVSTVGNHKILRGDLDPLFGEAVDFIEQGNGIHDHTVANNALLTGPEDAGGNEVKNVFLTVANNGVASVVTALSPHHDVGFLREEVDDLSLTFIAPLGANHYGVRHES